MAPTEKGCCTSLRQTSGEKALAETWGQEKMTPRRDFEGVGIGVHGTGDEKILRFTQI
jgi:hypothetical protein